MANAEDGEVGIVHPHPRLLRQYGAGYLALTNSKTRSSCRLRVFVGVGTRDRFSYPQRQIRPSGLLVRSMFGPRCHCKQS